MKKYQHILDLLPYGPSFCFVDDLEHIDENGATGTYTFKESASFYAGHFPAQPITPGVLLTECMAQIGLVALGVYLLSLKGKVDESLKIAFAESHVHFEKPVWPGETVKVVSRKIYWRMGKLKCEISMYNREQERTCYGQLSGLIRP